MRYVSDLSLGSSWMRLSRDLMPLPSVLTIAQEDTELQFLKTDVVKLPGPDYFNSGAF